MTEGGFQCGSCGQWHPGLPDCAFRRPDAIEKLSAVRRSKCFESDDLCEIPPPRRATNRRRYLRAVLMLPLVDLAGQFFAWGPWVRVRRSHFERALELWDLDGQGEPPFEARLANRIAGIANTRGMLVRVQLGDPDTRPTLRVADRAHPLWSMQREGILAHEAFELVCRHAGR
ncbi:MAG: DUF2199 domain-containing protein [Planctomycetes bacterium]|nr:DUF2199 domain-containing protein [Planctomycetota bacterium]